MLILLTGIFYNEIIYLSEWIDFHKKQGVSKFYIYVTYKNNKDDSQFNQLLNKYANDPNIVFLHLKYKFHIHVHDFFDNYYEKYYNDWISILDIDEFLYSPLKDKNINDIIDIYENKNMYAIGVNWKCFGSNNIIKNPEYKVLEKFTKCATANCGINFTVKSFFKINVLDNNKRKNNTNIHRFPLKSNYCYYTSSGLNYIEHNKKNIKELTYQRNNYLKYLNISNQILDCNSNYVFYEDTPYLLINHYITRSKEEYKLKIINNPQRNDRYNLNIFNNLNLILNNIENTKILEKI